MYRERLDMLYQLSCDDCDRGLYSNGHICPVGYGIVIRDWFRPWFEEPRLDCYYYRMGGSQWIISEQTGKVVGVGTKKWGYVGVSQLSKVGDKKLQNSIVRRYKQAMGDK